MSKNKGNKLNLSVIEQSNKKYNEVRTEKVYIDIDGEQKEFEIDIAKTFSPLAVKELLVEYIDNMQTARMSRRYDFEKIAEPYLLYLLIKHFTSLKKEIPRDFKQQLVSLQHMVNSEVFFQIISLFDINEVEKIKKELEMFITMIEENSDEIDKLIEEYYHKLQDKSLLD